MGIPDCGRLTDDRKAALAAYARALECGATPIMEVADLTHAGERYGGVQDPTGNVWWIASKVRDIPWDEQQRRMDALVAQELGR